MTILIIDRSNQIIERFESLVLEADSALIIYKSTIFRQSRILFYKFHPEVVLLDMEIRANKGFDLLKHIKELRNETIVVALSTLVNPGIREESEKLGADYFLDKYHEFDRIPAIIKKIGEESIVKGEII